MNTDVGQAQAGPTPRSVVRQTGCVTTGFVHPGSMGASLAAACRDESVWASSGRSGATARRAADAGLRDVSTLGALAEQCDVIVSICPPDAAVDVAAAVAGSGFGGIYVDANAIAPETTRRVAAMFGRFVDGAVVGPPAHRAGTTRLYLSGGEAGSVAARWEASVVDARVIGDGPASASALKMAYAGWTKGTTALLLATVALAEAEGVSSALFAEWAMSQPDLAERARHSAAAAGPKAWRWVGEMREIAATFGSNDLPAGFHAAAADIYARLAGLDGAGADVTLDDVIAALLGR